MNKKKHKRERKTQKTTRTTLTRHLRCELRTIPGQVRRFPLPRDHHEPLALVGFYHNRCRHQMSRRLRLRRKLRGGAGRGGGLRPSVFVFLHCVGVLVVVFRISIGTKWFFFDISTIFSGARVFFSRFWLRGTQEAS